ncbi:propanediol utilization protein [Primorskyibacter sedentarius]|uniref:propanediol utilization protein n=1 Tax=Primorskyibacter sedentarius TaxID=745311 RepID=UPI003EBC951D
MTRVFGHFGEWVQGRLGPDGPLALLTVACPAVHVDIRRVDTGGLALDQDPAILDLPRARAFLSHVGGTAGRFSITATMPAGGGAGASTAALVALARAAGGQEDALIDACIKAEGASDPLMLARPDGVLWAPREGRVLASVAPLPKAEIIGGFWGAPVKTDPADLDFPDISDLATGLQAGIGIEGLARMATASARRCTALRGPEDDPTEALAQALGAYGYLRAHTGSARGLIFAPGTVPQGAEAALRSAGYAHVLCFETGGGS